MKPAHLDLFTGIGGFTLAAESAGFETVGFSEIEPYACKVLKQCWPGIVNYGDIRTVPAIRCDLITGGFPCQPHSLAGKRRGSKDDRHLWPTMRDVIGRSKPAWVLGENVAGIKGVELNKVLSDLESLGYRVQPIVIPACAVDASHRRDRVWIVAYADEAGRREQRRIESMAPEHTAVEYSGQNVSDAAGFRRRPRLREDEPKFNGNQPSDSGEAMDYADEFRQSTDSHGECNGEAVGNREANLPRSPSQTGIAHWPVEPAVGRVVNGLPNRSHRLKGLGNAIVPQVAEVILRAIYQSLT